ncbi:MAG: cation-transporting P-type ATPase [Thermodesulfovibrionia bacterium]|nr:cation-transporting P-type ATPase [Thermodesulfovibrionia bacterium]
MNIHNLSIEVALKSLLTSAKGLSESEASKRLHEYGPNEIKEVRRTPLYKKFIAQFTHFLAILLWIAAALCFFSEYMHPGEGLLSLGIAISVVILINAVFTFIQEYRAEKAVEELKKLLPFRVKVLRDGAAKEIESGNVVPGDMMLLSEGDKVPADARIIESNRLMVNNAPLTGESDAKQRKPDEFSGEFFESTNVVFAGTLVVSGNGKAVAFATGMSTEFGKIAHLTGGVQELLSPLQKEITRVTKIVAVIAMITGISFFSLGFFVGKGFWQNFLFAIGIIIANVPEGLLPTVTLSLAMGSQRMAKKKALIKTLNSVETLGSVTVICTDKTGTLTQNKMEVQKIWRLEKEGSAVPSPDMLMATASLCNNATFENDIYKGDPTEVAILKAAREAIGDLHSERVYEIPFDSERKRMTTVNTPPSPLLKAPTVGLANGGTSFIPSFTRGGEGGVVVFTKGAMETVFPLCNSILINGKAEAMSEDNKNTITQAYHSMMDEGLRVIAFAYKEIKEDGKIGKWEDEVLEKDLVFTGLMGLQDPPRPEVPEAIKKCKAAGIKVIMITGDAGRTATAIGRQIGLVKNEPVLIEGHEMNAITDNELREKLSAEEIIFARMTPLHKMRIVSVLQDEGERVAVTGDGVNDAPALKKANIGIAMGITGTDVAREASDMILLDDNFASIVNAVEEGRSIFSNIRKFISYIFASNIPEAVPYIGYIIFNIPLPLTIMQILVIDLGTDLFPALALGAERPTKDVMSQPPRGPEERLLNFNTLGRAYLFLGPIEALAGMFGFFYVLNSGGWQWGTMLPANNLLYIQATTACLAGIIISQIGNVFACRSSRESVFSIGFFSNRLILLGVILEIILSAFIIYNPIANKIFGTAPLGQKVLIVLIPFSIGLFLAEELRKFYVRRFL